MPNIPLYHLLVVLMPGYLLVYAIAQLFRLLFIPLEPVPDLAFPDQAVVFIVAYVAGIILLGLRFAPIRLVDRLLRYPSFSKLVHDLDPGLLFEFKTNYRHVYQKDFPEFTDRDFLIETIHFRQVEKFVQLSGDWSAIEGMRLLKFFLENVMTAFMVIALFFVGALLIHFLVLNPFSFSALASPLVQIWPYATVFIIMTTAIAWYFPLLCRSYVLAVVHHFNTDITRQKLLKSNP